MFYGYAICNVILCKLFNISSVKQYLISVSMPMNLAPMGNPFDFHLIGY